jgi:hypothetical protein
MVAHRTMSDVGKQLRKEREEQNLPRADVSRATGVYIHHLAALEHGDYDQLPDDRTVAGFVRVYADFLGLDAEALVARFAEERGIEISEPPPEPTDRRPGHLVLVSSVIAVLLLVAVLGWLLFGGASNAESEPTPSAVPATVEATPEPIVAETEPPPPVSTLTIPEHGVGTGVEDHRLVGPADRFAVGTRVWFWTRVLGGTSGARIRHVWIHEGTEVFGIDLPLGSASWRTQSSKTMHTGSAGRWVVEARDETGTVLARGEFRCDP